MTDNGRRLVEAAKALGRDQTFRVLAGECARAVGLGLLGFAVLLGLDRVLPDPAVARTAFFPSLSAFGSTTVAGLRLPSFSASSTPAELYSPRCSDPLLRAQR